MSLDGAHNATRVLEPDDDPSVDPSPGQQIPSPRLFFGSSRPTAGEEEPSSSPSDLPSGAEWDSAGAEPTGPDESLPEIGPSASSAELLSERHLQKTFRAGIHTGTTTAHALAARTPGQQHVGLYKSDPDDEKAIGDPLASIAYRRGGLAGGKVSKDTSDFLSAVMGVVGYLSKQLRASQDARAIDGQIRAGARPAPDESLTVQQPDVDEVEPASPFGWSA